MIQPEPESEVATPAATLTPQQIEAIQRFIFDLRSALTAGESMVSPGGLLVPLGRESMVVPSGPNLETETHPLPTNTFIFGRNNRNTMANGVTGSTLAEPSAGNEGREVFSAGNFRHQEYSTDGGVSWTAVAMPAGPGNAPFACCDSDVVYDKPRGLTVASHLYVNSTSAPTEGVIRLFVRRTVPTQSCTYLIDTANPLGSTVLMDFPHLGLSNDFLYLATNELTISGGVVTAANARIRRFALDSIYDCVAASTTAYTWPSTIEGQKVWRPVEGATEIMYWAHHATTTSLRIFSWNEAAAAPTNVLRAVAASTFDTSVAGLGPDCRGGNQSPQRDWYGRVATRIAGFNKSGAVGQGRLAWYWNVMPDVSHTQGHVHSAIFSGGAAPPGTITLLAQPPLFNNGFCFGFPNISMNRRGDIGIAAAVGGKAGGAGVGFPAASGASPVYAVDDDFTAGIGFFGTLTAAVIGTHNRFPSGSTPDDRYGDYFTIHPQSPCDYFFSATGYALIGIGNVSPPVAFVNSRYVEFGRNRDRKCYEGWRTFVRVP